MNGWIGRGPVETYFLVAVTDTYLYSYPLLNKLTLLRHARKDKRVHCRTTKMMTTTLTLMDNG